MHEPAKKLRLEIGVTHGVVQPIKFFFNLPICIGGSDDIVAGIHLFDITIEIAKVLLPCHEIFLRSAHNSHHQKKCKKRGEDRGACHNPVCDDHHNKATNELRS